MLCSLWRKYFFPSFRNNSCLSKGLICTNFNSFLEMFFDDFIQLKSACTRWWLFDKVVFSCAAFNNDAIGRYCWTEHIVEHYKHIPLFLDDVTSQKRRTGDVFYPFHHHSQNMQLTEDMGLSVEQDNPCYHRKFDNYFSWIVFVTI